MWNGLCTTVRPVSSTLNILSGVKLLLIICSLYSLKKVSMLGLLKTIARAKPVGCRLRIHRSGFHARNPRSQPSSAIPFWKLCGIFWCSSDLQAVGFKKSDIITSSIPSTLPWLLTRPAVNFTLHCSDKSSIPPKIFKHRFYELCHEFKITIAYLLMALKKVTELLLLWSIETVCSITWYSKHLQSWITCPTACDRCGPVLKRKEFCNLFWFHVKSAIYQRLKSWLRSCSKVSEGLHYPCKNGSQVMWESSVMKKQMQLQNRHSPYLSLV